MSSIARSATMVLHFLESSGIDKLQDEAFQIIIRTAAFRQIVMMSIWIQNELSWVVCETVQAFAKSSGDRSITKPVLNQNRRANRLDKQIRPKLVKH